MTAATSSFRFPPDFVTSSNTNRIIPSNFFESPLYQVTSQLIVTSSTTNINFGIVKQKSQWTKKSAIIFFSILHSFNLPCFSACRTVTPCEKIQVNTVISLTIHHVLFSTLLCFYYSVLKKWIEHRKVCLVLKH